MIFISNIECNNILIYADLDNIVDVQWFFSHHILLSTWRYILLSRDVCWLYNIILWITRVFVFIVKTMISHEIKINLI